MPDRSSEQVNVGFVCTGNRFRSVLAAAAFEQAIADPRIHVESYGTLECSGLPPLPVALEEAAARGMDISEHRSRRLAKGALAQASLVVGFELRHVVAAIQTGGAQMDRAFVLLELLDLLTHTNREDDPEAVIARAHAARLDHPERRSMREIPDPVNLAPGMQHEIADDVASAAMAVAATVFKRR